MKSNRSSSSSSSMSKKQQEQQHNVQAFQHVGAPTFYGTAANANTQYVTTTSGPVVTNWKETTTYYNQGGNTNEVLSSAQGSHQVYTTQNNHGAPTTYMTTGNYSSSQDVGAYTTNAPTTQYTSHFGNAAEYRHQSQMDQFNAATAASSGYATTTTSARHINTGIRREISGGTNVSRRVFKGDECVVGYSEFVDEQRTSVISEKVVEREVMVPKRVVVEDVVEKVIVIPERIVHEKIVEEVQKVREKIIEVAKPIIQEKVVEVPEIVYVEKIVHVPEVRIEEKIREVKVPVVKEVVEKVPKIVYKEKIVDVPEYVTVEVPKIVHVPKRVVEEVVVEKLVPVPQYVDKPVPEYVEREVEVDVARKIPIPVEATTTVEYKLAELRPQYEKVDMNLYVPRFIEVPVPMEILDRSAALQAESFARQVSDLAAQTAISLCEIEKLAGNIKSSNIHSVIGSGNYQDALMDAWKSGRFHVNESTIRGAVTSSRGYSEGHRHSTKGKSHRHTHHGKKSKSTTTTTTVITTSGAQLASVQA